MSAYKIHTPRCPVCDTQPTMVMGPTQAFCGDEDCPAFCWNPSRTKAENLDGATFIDLSDATRPTQPGTGPTQ